MKLVADENIDGDIVRWLREQGHDVVYAAESATGDADDQLLKLAKQDRRVMLTGDLEFGELVYRLYLATEGIILLRFRVGSSEARLRLFQQHWGRVQQALPRVFVTLTNHRVRIRPLPMMGQSEEGEFS